MRLFAALELPDEVIGGLQAWWSEASACLPSACLPSAGWRPVPSHLWHLTLAFYGDVGADNADALSEQLAECAALSSPIQMQTGGFGVFPRPMRPRVFWAGVDDCNDDKPLKRLAHCCRRAGHATVRKQRVGEAAFRGHITLARARRQVKPFDAGSMLPEGPEILWHADRMCLFQSVLRPEGPLYRRLEIFKFKCSCDDTRGTYDR